MPPIITVENLCKTYRLGARQAPYATLRESLVNAVKAPLHWLKRSRRNGAETLHALRDVSFTVEPGEVVGIIGRNGAGKSTLLKILSRITEPTRGEVIIRGRVGSLLEVGTGFHPELTGRDNIYLNGAILGMKRREIARKFDEIVAFAEVDRFIDTAVKYYSSGMYMRLAFAVAAHLEPEILIVDEVLAVGDAEFQKKCLGKMSDVARQGRTVLFVSHNMAAVQNLCANGVLLSQGRIQTLGKVSEVISRYLSALEADNSNDLDLRNHPSRVTRGKPIIERVRLFNPTREQTEAFACGDRMTIEMYLNPSVALHSPQLGIGVNDQFGQRLFTLATYYSPEQIGAISGCCIARCHIEELPLAPGRYSLTLAAGTPAEPTKDWLQHAAFFTVVEADYFACGRYPHAGHGPFLVRSSWSLEETCLDLLHRRANQKCCDQSAGD
jgi:lipopolysaccharide transport system ATP-binding protein